MRKTMNLKDIYFKNKETKDLGIVELLRKNAKAKFATDFVWLPKYTLAPKDLANWFFRDKEMTDYRDCRIALAKREDMRRR